MNEQMIYIGMTIIAVACLFLIYQNYQMRMAHALDISRINKTIKDMSGNMDGKKLLSSPEPQIKTLEEFNSNEKEPENNELDSAYNKLKNEYENYINTDIEQIESHSEGNNDDVELDEALKQKIEKLSQMEDSLDENLVEPHQELNLDNDTNNLSESQNYIETDSNNQASGENLDEEQDENIEVDIETTENEVMDNDNTDISINQELQSEEVIETQDISELEEVETNFDYTENQDISLDNTEIDNSEGFKVEELNTDLNLDDMETLEIGDNLEEVSSEQLMEESTESLSTKLNSSEEYLSNLTLRELQTLAKEKNVKVKGRKSELIERLMSKN